MKDIFWKNKRRKILSIFILIFVLIFLAYLFKTPDRNQNWQIGHKKLAQIIFENKDSLKIKNFRDFDWKNKLYKYKEVEVNLNDLKSAKIVEARFLPVDFISHDFIIFELENGKKIGVSIESRRVVGDNFSLLKGALPYYNLIYIWSSDDDLLGIRKIKKQRLRFYNLKLKKDELKKIFILLAKDTNQIYQKPEFYNLFFRNCTNLLMKNFPEKYQDRVSFLTNHFAPGWLIDDLRK